MAWELDQDELVEHWTLIGESPLIWAHVAMHGGFKLNMHSRLDLGQTRT